MPIAEGIVIGLARMNRILEVDVPNRRARVQPGVANLEVSRRSPGTASTTRPTPPASRCARSAATSPRTLVERTASSTASRPTTCSSWRSCWPTAAWSRWSADRPLDLLGGVRRLRGHARDRDRGRRPVAAAARAGGDDAGRVPVDRRCRRGRSRHHRVGDRAGRDRDDGRARDRGGRGGRARGAAGGRGRGAPGRAGRAGGGGRAALRAVRRSVARTAPARCGSPPTRPSGRRFWCGRKAAFAAMGRVSPDYYVQDGVVPRERRLPEALRRIGELSRTHGLRVGQRVPRRRRQPAPAGAVRRVRSRGRPSGPSSLPASILQACVDAGGSLTGEHGIGVDKACHMPRMYSDTDDLAAMLRLRSAFDPAGLCNPGKAFPTPRLCGEVPGPYRQHPAERDGVERL